MAIRNIRMSGDDILRKKCREVKKMTPRLVELVDDMFDTMYENMGVGLAAPQVGVLKRIVVIDVGDDQPVVLINPEIIERDGEQTGDEGCLSLPGKAAVVTRPDYVKAKALDISLEPYEVEGYGLKARAICHELDHLDGVLYTDIMEGELHDVTAEEYEEYDEDENEEIEETGEEA